MNSIKVSVIIPIYNVEEYLEECLESVVKQTLDSLQVIMVNDGSTDASGEIAKRYEQKYDCFDYIYQNNGGLGNARNTGVKHAKGDYLVFLDSDDMVPPYAYEKMYRAAEKNQSDMAIGNVIRFNSKREMPSATHDIVFQNIVAKTHINENKNLIYDGMAWNKLIRKDFWDKQGFQFPEGMLYEDIPITIPMHCLANHVSMVYDICYMWRVRDGVNKSITQMADDDKNFHDRLKALRIVDRFFEENVTNEKLIYQKHFRWLSQDLMIFINTVLFLEEDVIEKRAQAIKLYIDEVIPEIIIDDLPAIARQKFHYMLNGEFKNLIQLREYELHGYGNIRINKKGKQYYTKFPKGLITGDVCDMKTTLEYRRLRQSMYKIKKDDGCYVIEGYVCMPGLNVNWKNSQSLKAYLFQLETNEKIPIQVVNQYTLRPTKRFGIKVDNEYKHLNLINYSGSGYRIMIRLQEDIIANNLSGEYKILLEYERDCWKHQVFLSGTVQAAKNKKISTILENEKIDLEIIKNQVLQISVNKIHYLVKESQICNNVLRIIPNQISTEYYFKYNDDSFKKADVTVKGEGIEIPCNSIPDEQVELGVLQAKTFTALCWKSEFRKVYYFDNIQVLEQSSGNYHYRINTRVNASNIYKAEQKGSIIKLEVSKTSTVSESVKDCYLFFDDPLIEGRTVIAQGVTEYQKDKLVSKFQLKLNNHEITKNLYKMKRQIFICYNGDREIIDTIFGMDKVYNFEYVTKTRKYQILVDRADKLVLNVTLRRGYFGHNEKKRRLFARFIYPLFRKLPIKEKTIIFESTGGTKFSCNPRGIYEYIVKEHPEYTCVWSLKDACIPITGNGIRVRRSSLMYYYYLARTKYLVNNVNFEKDYVKRKKQIEVQTMHGTPLKTIGLDVPGDFPTRKQKESYIKRCKNWDYLVVQSNFAADLAKTAFLFDKDFMFTGYPRTDVLYQKSNEQDIRAQKEKFGLPTDKKVIMYAPTWRVRNKFKLMLEIDKFKEKLADEYVMILRVHHLAVRGWKGLSEDGFFFDFSSYGAIEDLYMITDILITDYSSIMFDYAILKRPMLFFVYDLDVYSNELRGFNIDLEKESPGELVFNSDEVLNGIINIGALVEKNKGRVEAFKQKYIHYEGSDSSRRVFEQMIHTTRT